MVVSKDEDEIKETKRKPKKIRKFFSNIYQNITGKGEAIDEIRLDVEEFVRYVKIVSN